MELNRTAEDRVVGKLRSSQELHERALPNSEAARRHGPGVTLREILGGLSRPERRATRKALARLMSEGAVVTVKRTWRYSGDPDDDGLLYVIPAEAQPGA